ncbi:MAG: hypothetical protein CBB79_10250 [Synechococcus sp. TMED19]|mgnify:CR=1 FL=1|nr:MAG: hypothetical protein CBB79_10250 [Synechococcus sp. TMED19]
MTTQTLELKAVTDEELQVAAGGALGLIAKGAMKAATKAMPGVTLGGAATFGAQQGLHTGIEVAKEVAGVD